MKNPILLKIEEQEKEIKEEISLKKTKRTFNKIVICTSVLLLSGTVIGLFRILSRLFFKG